MKNSKKILVVDDETTIRNLLFEFLSMEGFQVSLAQDGQESLGQLEKSAFDLVITDIDMPGMDGIAMMKWMKKVGRKEKLIVMTGNPARGNAWEENVPPVARQITKPFSLFGFLDMVNMAVSA
ncbi:MAG: response regulator [Desulfatiglandaceae bacterium]|jgi:DNA-binding NtrC family response regulator